MCKFLHVAHLMQSCPQILPDACVNSSITQYVLGVGLGCGTETNVHKKRTVSTLKSCTAGA